MHLHIENCTALGEIFEVTQQCLDETIARHKELASQITITLGTDGDIIDDVLPSVNLLFAWDFDRNNLQQRAPNLQCIQLQGAGVSHLTPFDWVPAAVTITNSRGAHGACASEYLMMSILALNNQLPAMVHNQYHNQWQKIHSTTLAGKTLLIIGVGHIGGDTAALAKNFGMKVIGIRRSGESLPVVDEMYQPQHLHKLLPQADFVLVTAPHTQLTHRIIGEDEFKLMRKGTGFINYSRSQLVDYTAMQQVLEQGKISAIVDVFDTEPLPKESALWKTPNLIITPHCASNDPVNHTPRSLDLLFQNIKRLLTNKSLINRVDLDAQY